MEIDLEWFGSQGAEAERAVQALQLKTAAHDGTWGLGQADWNADLRAGTLTFTGERMQAVTRVQVVGTYDTDSGTFLWGWDHPSVPESVAQAARAVLAFAQEHGLQGLQKRKVACTEDDAWAFTALAAQLTDAQGAYRGPVGPTLVFMTFSDVQLSGIPDTQWSGKEDGQ